MQRLMLVLWIKSLEIESDQVQCDVRVDVLLLLKSSHSQDCGWMKSANLCQG